MTNVDTSYLLFSMQYDYPSTPSLRSSRSERFLGDQFLPQMREQEEMEHERSEWDRARA